MYILKPEKGFVIPVEYMSNSWLFNEDSAENNFRKINNEREEKYLVSEESKVNEFKDDVVRDRLFFEENDLDTESSSNSIQYIEREEYNNVNGRGVLIFDDEDQNKLELKLDEQKIIECERAKNNLRKAVEVEMEKVGKLVLEDEDNESFKVISKDNKSDNNILSESNREELQGNKEQNEQQADNVKEESKENIE